MRRKKPSVRYLNYKEKAREMIKVRLEYFNSFYNFEYKRIFIKNHKSRWGSCSKRGNLNFNYRLVHLSPHLSDYIIVHELCHLGEFNHSKRFWALVEKTMPDWRARRKELMNIRSNFVSLKTLIRQYVDMAKKTKKQIRNKDMVRTHQMHPTVPARLEGKARNAKLRSKKATQKEIRKPRKKRKA